MPLHLVATPSSHPTPSPLHTTSLSYFTVHHLSSPSLTTFHLSPLLPYSPVLLTSISPLSLFLYLTSVGSDQSVLLKIVAIDGGSQVLHATH